MIDLLDTGVDFEPPRVLIYGPEGIGKTTFAAGSPACVFIPTEKGTGRVTGAKTFPLARTFSDVMNYLLDLRANPRDRQSVSIDSVDWLERLIWDHVCSEWGAASMEQVDGGWGKGYKYAVTYWRQFVEFLDDLHSRHGMCVILIAHAQVLAFNDPEGQAYDRWMPRLHNSEKFQDACPLICEWVDAILFASQKKRIKQDENNKKRATAHALGDERVIRTVGGPACVAKNRYGITQELPLSWAAFADAITPKGEVTNG